ncbi:uncharacterized protein LOC109598764 [Aethina tumida]|uniref:uncharacterized protein LOC109598764 n=1 Tax=Aethina tumida TaxID=116153 RepID=UPI0021478A31|nr:uncharacterized protein LOC109598764 [Aethina tumida]
MFLVLKKLVYWYFKVFEYADPRTEDLWLMKSPFLIVGFAGFYLYLVNYLKRFMKQREPYDIKHVMLLYNGLQVVFNSYIFYYALLESLQLSLACSPVIYSHDPWQLFILRIAYFYFITKLLDTLDTLFFILRKKDSHVSFLHTYHHFGMILLTWFGVKFLGGGHSIYLGVINSFVHMCMYSYYFLSALDEKYKQKIWLKKLITQLQMIQFFTLTCIFGYLLFTDCSYPKYASFVFVPQCIFMQCLFGEFYYRTYITPKKKTKLYQGYFWIFEECPDPRVNDYFLLASPLHVLPVGIAYLYFCLNLGPRLMKNREAFDLKYTLIIFNIIQVVVNAYVLLGVVIYLPKLDLYCGDVDYSVNPDTQRLIGTIYIYFLMKILDLLDTVFFVLRKKQSQVSFLHVYHHFNMVMASWIAMKFLAGGATIVVGAVNAFVHIVMYSYYLLTAYDENYKNSIWWKKHITQLQLVQFLFFILYFGRYFFISGCTYPLFITFLFIPQNFFMLCLFGEFYYRTYIKGSKPAKTTG